MILSNGINREEFKLFEVLKEYDSRSKADEGKYPIPFDTRKAYKTRGGDKVIIHEIVMKNAIGETVTFPVKGTIINKENPRKKKYEIFMLDGRTSIFGERKADIVGLWS